MRLEMKLDTMAESIIKKNREIVYKTVRLLTEYVLTKSAYYLWEADVSLPGYTAVGILGYDLQGNNSAHVNIQQLRVMPLENKVRMGIQNLLTSNVTLTVNATILYDSDPKYLE